MAFFIKDFRIEPQALEPDDAIPNGTQLNMTTEVECLSHPDDSAQQTYEFHYFVADVEVAEGTQVCASSIHPNAVTDARSTLLNVPGNGEKKNIVVQVTVTEQASGAANSASQSTWVQT